MKLLKNWIEECNNIVFLGGAGVSTASGIPDYRGANGMYKRKYDYSLEDILSKKFLDKDPSIYYNYYRDNMKDGYQPNIVHKRLVQLEEEGKLKAVITQNIDGLHQLAGSKNVLELHGSIYRYYCMSCYENYDKAFVDKFDGVPYCHCGGVVRPSVVLFGEPLDSDITHESIEAIYNADMLIVGGTSLVVYPAAGYVSYFRGKHLVLINNEPTAIDAHVDLAIYDDLAKVFSQI
ncbi:MAG: NAD-dependent protein deacylase [Christensenellaceae bacterium]|nr:NAD-dependent protein deacylase [Christensenellaceae bacterium]